VSPVITRVAHDDAAPALARELVRARLFSNAGAMQLGRYAVRRVIGSGAMGVVVEAYDPELDREVAIKCLHDSSEKSRERLINEARFVAKLHHPNVVGMYDVGEQDDRVYIVMELVKGSALSDWLETRRSWIEAVAVMTQAGEGLAAAHAEGILHRDFKAANVLVGADGRVRVADFGLAHPIDVEADDLDATRSDASPPPHTSGAGIIVGTPAYMAPEVLRGAPADERSDQYGYCVTLYEALFHQRPFEMGNFDDIREAALHRRVVIPQGSRSLPAVVRGVIERGLAEDPQARFSTMRELLDRLGAAFTDSGIATPIPLPTVTAEISRLKAYLAQLPNGLDSHPGCQTLSLMARLALTRRPLRGALPPFVADLVHALDSEWIPTAHYRSLMLAAYEHGGYDFQSWCALMRGVFRATLSSGFLGYDPPPPRGEAIMQSIVDTYRELQRGCEVFLSDSGPAGATLVVRSPAHLSEKLAQIEVSELATVCFQLGGVRIHDIRPGPRTDTELRVIARWS